MPLREIILEFGRGRLVLLFSGVLLLFLSSVSFVIALRSLVQHKETGVSSGSLWFLFPAFVFCVGGLICTGASAGVIGFGGRNASARMRPIISVSGGLLLVLHATFLVIYWEMVLNSLDVGRVTPMPATLTIGIGLSGLVLSLTGISFIASAGRTRRRFRYFSIAVCIPILSLSALILSNVFIMVLGYAGYASPTDYLVLGVTWGVAGSWGIYSVGRIPRNRETEVDTG